MRRIVLSLIASMAIFGVSAGATLAGVLAWHFGACGLAVLAAGIAAVAAFLYFTEVFP